MKLTFKTTQTIIGDNKISAYLGEVKVGELILLPPRPWVDNASIVRSVSVDEHHRRQGIATAMWDHAVALELNPAHDLTKTEDGKAWADFISTR